MKKNFIHSSLTNTFSFTFPTNTVLLLFFFFAVNIVSTIILLLYKLPILDVSGGHTLPTVQINATTEEPCSFTAKQGGTPQRIRTASHQDILPE